MSIPYSEEEKSLKAVPPSQAQLPVLIYEPGSQLRHPLRFFKQMWLDLLQSRELAIQLFIRDTQAQYRQSILGLFWIFAPPIVAVLATSAVKGLLVQNNSPAGGAVILGAVAVMLSTSMWQAFQSSFLGGINGIRTAKKMMSKIRVPPEAFVLNYVGQALFKFFIQLALFLLLVIAYHLTGNGAKAPITWSALIAPIAFIHLLFFGIGMGLILAPLSILYKDIMTFSNIVLRGLFFVTPVLYSVPKQEKLAWLVNLNPIATLLVSARELVFQGTISHPTQFWLTSIVSIFLLCFGWIFNRLAIPMIIERGA